jgi:hypothetical protein
MAGRQRPSSLKLERERRKRERDQKKAEKAALKRERRLQGKESEAGAPPGDEPPSGDDSSDQPGA